MHISVSCLSQSVSTVGCQLRRHKSFKVLLPGAKPMEALSTARQFSNLVHAGSKQKCGKWSAGLRCNPNSDSRSSSLFCGTQLPSTSHLYTRLWPQVTDPFDTHCVYQSGLLTLGRIWSCWPESTLNLRQAASSAPKACLLQSLVAPSKHEACSLSLEPKVIKQDPSSTQQSYSGLRAVPQAGSLDVECCLNCQLPVCPWHLTGFWCHTCIAWPAANYCCIMAASDDLLGHMTARSQAMCPALEFK